MSNPVIATVARMAEHGDEAGILLRLGDVRAFVAAHAALQQQSDERLTIIHQMAGEIAALRSESEAGYRREIHEASR